MIFTKSGIEHAEETFRRARVGGVCQQRSQHKSKVRKVSRVAPPPLRQRKCVFPLDIFFSIVVSAHLRKFPFRRFGRRDNSWTSLELHHRVAPACFGILRRQSDERCRNKRERHGGGAPMMSKSCLSCQTFRTPTGPAARPACAPALQVFRCVGAWMCAHTPGKRVSLVRTADEPPFLPSLLLVLPLSLMMIDGFYL